MLGCGSFISVLFWVLVLSVLFIFSCIKNRLAVASTEEKETMMNKKLFIPVLSFFELVSVVITGLVVNSASGSAPLT